MMVEQALLTSDGEEVRVTLSMRDKNGEALAVSGSITGQVLGATGAVECTATAPVEENVVRMDMQKRVFADLEMKCPPAGKNRKMRLAFTPNSGGPLEVTVTLDEDAARLEALSKAEPKKPEPVAAPAVVDEAPEPWAPDSDAPPATLDMHDEEAMTITRNLKRAEELMKSGKDPVNPCQAVMVLNQLHRDAEREVEIRRVCVKEAVAFWVPRLVKQLQVKKNSKQLNEALCTKAQAMIARVEASDQLALSATVKPFCGAVEKRCTVDTEMGEVSGVEGGLPCAAAELLANELKAKGIDAKVQPAK